MKRRYAVLAVVFAVSVLIGIQVVEVAEANPVPWLSTPNREKPVLTLQSPTNQATYKTEVPIDFTVTAPESWATFAVRLVGTAHYVGEVKYIAVYLDSKPLINYTTGRIVSYFYGNKTNYYISGFDGESTHYLFNLNQTTSGSHTLNVTVVSFTYADGDPLDDTAIAFQTGSINGEPIYAYKYPNIVSEVVHFTVEQPTSLAQPTPYELLPPSTIAPSENYSVPPLSSLNLKVVQPYGSAIGGLIHIKGGSGNDINFRVVNSQGKIILDLGRISNEKSFQFFADRTGNFTMIFDNEFSVFSSKEVDVFSYSYPNNLFEFAGSSFNFWVIILVFLLFVTSMVLVVWLIKHKQK